MANTSSPDTRPSRPLILFGLLLIAVFALIFLTGDRKPVPNLGIDLQGGTSVTLQAVTPDGSAPTTQQLEQARNIINTRVNGLGVSGSEVLISGNNIEITVPGTDGDQARTLGQTARLFVRPVLSSTPAVAKPNAPVVDLTNPEAASQALRDAKSTRQSTDPAVQQRAAAELNCDAPADPLAGNDDPALPLVTCNKVDPTATTPEPRVVYTLAPSIIDGQQIADPSSGLSQARYVVTLNFTGGASGVWADFTGKNVGKQAAFVLDSQVISAPSINGPIAGWADRDLR